MRRDEAIPKAMKFTLLELLIVVGIIAILFAILLPSLKIAKMKVYDVACLNNLKQIGSAHMLYADDHNGWFPYTNGTTVADQNHFCAPGGIWPYLNSGKDWQHCPVYVCPNGHSPTDTWAKVGFTIAAGWDYGHQYGYGFLSNYRSYNCARVRHGSQKAYLLDAGTPSTSYGEILLNSAWLPAYRHSSGANLLFFDFHAQREQMADIRNNKDDLLYPPE